MMMAMCCGNVDVVIMFFARMAN